jgi:hypothetical protein
MAGNINHAVPTIVDQLQKINTLCDLRSFMLKITNLAAS